MIYIVGDTHRDYDVAKIYSIDFKAGDKLIIAGDFGCIWCRGHKDGYGNMVPAKRDMQDITRLYGDLNIEVLFLDGNHDNHDVLNGMAVEQRYGGKVHKVNDYCYHLMRGQVYTIDGVKIFTLGGALSIDKKWRRPHVSWWEGEQVSEYDINIAKENLAKYNYNVDLVITHTCPTDILNLLESIPSELSNIKFKVQPEYHDVSTDYLQELDSKLTYKRWLFGHFHMDSGMLTKDLKTYQCLYDDYVVVEPIGSKEKEEDETKSKIPSGYSDGSYIPIYTNISS